MDKCRGKSNFAKGLSREMKYQRGDKMSISSGKQIIGSRERQQLAQMKRWKMSNWCNLLRNLTLVIIYLQLAANVACNFHQQQPFFTLTNALGHRMTTSHNNNYHHQNSFTNTSTNSFNLHKDDDNHNKGELFRLIERVSHNQAICLCLHTELGQALSRQS